MDYNYKYLKYKNKYSQLKNIIKGGTKKEFIAYHGTDEKNIPSIFLNGFDNRLKSGYGSNFGSGVYLTPDLKYASTYSDGNKVLICKIITDKYITVTQRFAKSFYNKREYDEIKSKYDLIIIEDQDDKDIPVEYLCTDNKKVSVIGLKIIEKTIKEQDLIETLESVKTIDCKIIGENGLTKENIFL